MSSRKARLLNRLSGSRQNSGPLVRSSDVPQAAAPSGSKPSVRSSARSCPVRAKARLFRSALGTVRRPASQHRACAILTLPHEALVLIAHSAPRISDQAMFARSSRCGRAAVKAARRMVMRLDLRPYQDVVDDLALAHVSRCFPALIELNAKNCILLHRPAVRSISTLSNLQQLDLSYDNRPLTDLHSQPATATLSRRSLSGDCVMGLALGLSKLTELKLSHCQGVNIYSLTQLAHSCPQLRLLSLRHCPHVNSTALGPLTRCRVLQVPQCTLARSDACTGLWQRIDLSFCPINFGRKQPSLSAQALCCCPALEVVSIGHTGANREVVRSLSGIKQLKALDIGASNIDNETVMHLIKERPSLAFLDLADCKGLTGHDGQISASTLVGQISELSNTVVHCPDLTRDNVEAVGIDVSFLDRFDLLESTSKRCDAVIQSQPLEKVARVLHCILYK